MDLIFFAATKNSGNNEKKYRDTQWTHKQTPTHTLAQRKKLDLNITKPTLNMSNFMHKIMGKRARNL